MSEQQTETEPTPGPWDSSPQKGEPGNCFQAQVWGPEGEDLAQLAPSIPPKVATVNARLIAAAGTAASEAKEMGYDPQQAVETLPDLLLLIEESVDFYRKLHKQTGIEAAKRQAENFESVLQNARPDQ